MVDFVSKTWGQFQFFYLFNLKTWESMWLELIYRSATLGCFCILLVYFEGTVFGASSFSFNILTFIYQKNKNKKLIYSSFWIFLIALINLACRALKNKLYSLSYISNNTLSGRVMQLGVFLFLKFFGLFYSEYLVKLEFMYWTFFKFLWLAWYIWLWGL